jgi:hypothetical protein
VNTTSIRALLEKPSRSNASPLTAVSAHVDRNNEYEPFANGRIGNHPQLTLVFRKQDGSVRGFSYSYFYSIESNNPTEGFVIDFSHIQVEVQGRHLEHLFRLVCDHRAADIVEARHDQVFARPELEPVVEEIRLTDKP